MKVTLKCINRIIISIPLEFTETYGNDTRIMYINSSGRDMSQLTNEIQQVVGYTSEYDGTFVDLLHRAPHMGIINVTDYNLSRMNITVMYNDTMQHSLPIVFNVFSNAYHK